MSVSSTSRRRAEMRGVRRVGLGVIQHRFDGRGEMIPNDDSFCELDPEVVDQWGVPVLRFTWKWSEHETRQAAHMVKTFAEIIQSMGGKVNGNVETVVMTFSNNSVDFCLDSISARKSIPCAPHGATRPTCG